MIGDKLKKTDVKNYKPENNVVYPTTSLGNSLKQIAQLIKMDVGIGVAFAESMVGIRTLTKEKIAEYLLVT